MPLHIDVNKIFVSNQNYKIRVEFKLYESVTIHCDGNCTTISEDIRNLGEFEIEYPPKKYGLSHSIINELLLLTNGAILHTIDNHRYGLYIDAEHDVLCFISESKKYRDIVLSYKKDKDILIKALTKVKEIMTEIDNVFNTELYNKSNTCIKIRYQDWYKCGCKECNGKLCGDKDCGIKTYDMYYYNENVINWSIDIKTSCLPEYLMKLKNKEIKKFQIDDRTTISTINDTYIMVDAIYEPEDTDDRFVLKIDDLMNLIKN